MPTPKSRPATRSNRAPARDGAKSQRPADGRRGAGQGARPPGRSAGPGARGAGRKDRRGSDTRGPGPEDRRSDDRRGERGEERGRFGGEARGAFGAGPKDRRPSRDGAAPQDRRPSRDGAAPQDRRPSRDGAGPKDRRPSRDGAPQAKRAPGVASAGRGWSVDPSKPPPRTKPPTRGISATTRAAAKAAITKPGKERLQKVLSAAGVAARRKAEDLITAGRVKVNGKVVKELGTKVDPDRDQIWVDGKHVQILKKVYFVLNKPDGVVCSAEGNKDNEGRPTVLSLFPDLGQRIYPVGRLDFHTRGVLVMTNDGELAAALTHPRHEVSKTYHVKFQGRLDEEDLGRLAAPITLEDGTVTRAAEEVSVIKDTETNTWVQITIRQGLNRQIRRMGEAIGRTVLKLIRVAVAGLTADGLADGEFRPLTPTEVYDLMQAANPEPAKPRKKAADKPAGKATEKTAEAAPARSAAKPARSAARPSDKPAAKRPAATKPRPSAGSAAKPRSSRPAAGSAGDRPNARNKAATRPAGAKPTKSAKSPRTSAGPARPLAQRRRPG